MNILAIIILSIGLATDALTVSVINGITNPKINKKNMSLMALIFGLMQGLMPLIGFLVGAFFLSSLQSYLGLISFIILSLLGIKMIFSKEEICKCGCGGECIKGALTVKAVVLQSIATSIDALAVGVIFIGTNTINQVFVYIVIIGIITTVLCYIGVLFSKNIGKVLKGKTQLIGGIMLIIVALFIYLESFL